MNLKEEFIKLDSHSRHFNLEYPIIALTGGIATGKSTVANILRERELPVICADDLIKEIYKTDKALSFIKKEFPASMSEDKIDFKKLREIAFSDDTNLKKLEDFLYPHLKDAFLKKAQVINPSFIIYDIPLLFEKSLQNGFDLSCLVYTSTDIQNSRLISRDGISKDLAQKVIAKQMPIDKKRDLADVVIDNCRDLKHLESQVISFLDKYFTQA